MQITTKDIMASKKEETRELLSDYINFHTKEKNLNDQRYFEMKASAKKYVDCVIEPKELTF